MLYLLVQTEVAEGIGGQHLPTVFQSRGGKEGDTDRTLPMCWDHLGYKREGMKTYHVGAKIPVLN